MLNFQDVSVKKALMSIIKSIDLYNYLLQSHHRRTAIIAYQLGNRLESREVNLSELVLAASLHDIGALNIKERDQLLEVDVDNPEPHEKLGAYMLEGFEPFDGVRKIVRHHHIKYEEVEKGKVPDEEVPFECYILHLADRIEILSHGEGEKPDIEAITRQIMDRFGSVFHPDLEEVFLNLISEVSFWDNVESQSFQQLLYTSMNSPSYSLSFVDAENLALIFAKIVDLKSPWTSNHSRCVSALAYQLGRYMGLNQETCFELRLAGYLHDIGKIATPTELLDKPSRLTPEEFRRVKEHAMFTSLILNDIGGLEQVAAWASSHHEKRDHSGYPMQLSSQNFTIPMDVLAFADILTALLEDRPYRPKMSKAHIKKILESFVPNQLSQDVYDVLVERFDELQSLHIKVSQSLVHIPNPQEEIGV